MLRGSSRVRMGVCTGVMPAGQSAFTIQLYPQATHVHPFSLIQILTRRLAIAQVNHQVLLNTVYEARNSTKAALDPNHHVQAPQGEQCSTRVCGPLQPMPA